MSRLELKVPPLLQLAVCGTGMGLMVAISPLPAADPLAISLISVFSLVGTFFCGAGVWYFRKQKTTVDPRYPERSTALVVSGIYQYTRNPMYVGFVSFLLAEYVLVGQWMALTWVLAFVWYLTRYQIIPEERALRKIFGEEYTQYQKSVPRWLLGL
jgi:protein-S-isoprenylcysteine O-methyltransferase Ste14